MLWLYLDFYALQLDALDLEALELEASPQAPEVSEAQPVILVEAKHNTVVQYNKAAGSVGIEIGMGLAMAISLSNQVSVLEYKPELEGCKIQQVAQLLYQFTADIVLEPPQGLFLRIDTMFTLYHGLDTYWQNMQQPLGELGYLYRYATGSTPLMAKLLAKTGRNRIEASPEAMKQALQQLPIAQLELESKTAQSLVRVGINQLGQLLALPMKELARRFDIHVLNYIGRLTGELKHGLALFQPPRHFQAEMELMFEVTNTQCLCKPINKLLKQLEQYLRLHALVTQSIHFALMYRYDEYIEIRVARASGEYKSDKWQALLELKLESVKLEEPVVGVRLWADKLRPITASSGDLFEVGRGDMAEDELFALLQAKVGNDKVLSMDYGDSHHPEFATQLRPLCNADSDKKRKDALCHKEEEAKFRPSLQLAKPIPLRHKVQILLGPERLQTRWWDKHKIQRDYFIAREVGGKLCWVFRTPNKHWFLHGYFA